MVLETGCWLFEMFRAGWGSFLFRDSMREREGEKDGSVYSNRDILEWLDEKISWLEIRYGDQKIHENGLEKVFLCRSVCIVITSL